MTSADIPWGGAYIVDIHICDNFLLLLFLSAVPFPLPFHPYDAASSLPDVQLPVTFLILSFITWVLSYLFLLCIFRMIFLFFPTFHLFPLLTYFSYLLLTSFHSFLSPYLRITDSLRDVS
jgi:hypothetical protein